MPLCRHYIQIESDRSVPGSIPCSIRHNSARHRTTYTPEERARRDATRWTLVQGILAPLQFLVFLVSLGLVVNYLSNRQRPARRHRLGDRQDPDPLHDHGHRRDLGKSVFGQYLFAPAFYWEDVVSMAVIALHTAYLACLAVRYRQHRATAVDCPRRLRHLRDQRRAVPAQAAGRTPR
jgi:3-vinyl bacteriochlorophyllide hydratase